MAFVYAPENICVKNIDGLHIAKDSKTNSLVIGVPLRFEQNFIDREINFDWVERPVDMALEDFA